MSSEPSGKLSKLSKLHPFGGGSKLLSLKPAKNKMLQSLKPVNGGKSGKLPPLGGAGGSKAMGKMLSEDYDSPSVIANASTDDESEDGAANAKLSKLKPAGTAISKRILSEDYERPSITAAESSEDEDEDEDSGELVSSQRCHRPDTRMRLSITAAESSEDEDSRSVSPKGQRGVGKLSALSPDTRMRLLSEDYDNPSIERSSSDQDGAHSPRDAQGEARAEV